MNENSKSIFTSKTAFAGALSAVAGALGTFVPEASPFIAQHASTILLCSGLVHMALRFATKGRVTLFPE